MRAAALALGCLVSLLAGCCMCAAPYDYCAPTFTGQCGEDCRPHARVNSAFSGPGALGFEPTLATEGPMEMQGVEMQGGELPNPQSAVPRSILVQQRR
jgi:hypothetical protein